MEVALGLAYGLGYIVFGVVAARLLFLWRVMSKVGIRHWLTDRIIATPADAKANLTGLDVNIIVFGAFWWPISIVLAICYWPATLVVRWVISTGKLDKKYRDEENRKEEARQALIKQVEQSKKDWVTFKEELKEGTK